MSPGEQNKATQVSESGSDGNRELNLLFRGFHRFRVFGWVLIALAILGLISLTGYAVFFEKWELQNDDGTWVGVIIAYAWGIALIIMGVFLARAEQHLVQMQQQQESKRDESDATAARPQR
jgi:hypothetical protein